MISYEYVMLIEYVMSYGYYMIIHIFGRHDLVHRLYTCTYQIFRIQYV